MDFLWFDLFLSWLLSFLLKGVQISVLFSELSLQTLVVRTEMVQVFWTFSSTLQIFCCHVDTTRWSDCGIFAFRTTSGTWVTAKAAGGSCWSDLLSVQLWTYWRKGICPSFWGPDAGDILEQLASPACEKFSLFEKFTLISLPKPLCKGHLPFHLTIIIQGLKQMGFFKALKFNPSLVQV